MKTNNEIQLFTPSGCLSADAMMHVASSNLNVSDATLVQSHLSSCEFCREAMQGVASMSSPQSLQKHVSDIRKHVTVEKYFRWQNQPTLYYAAAATLTILFVSAGLYLWYPKQSSLALKDAPTQTNFPYLTNPIAEKDEVMANEINEVAVEQPQIRIPSPAVVLSPVEPAIASSTHAEEQQLPAPQIAAPSTAMASSNKRSVAGSASGGASSSAYADAESFSSRSSDSKLDNANVASKSKSSADNYRVTTEYDNLYKNSFSNVEEVPKFVGGEKGLNKYIASQLNYPEAARENGIEGKVLIQFMINKEGKVQNAIVVKSVDSLFDDEAMRVINNLPRWVPGRVAGKPVNSYYIVPVEFKLGGN